MKLVRPFKRFLRVASRTSESEPGYAVLPYRGYGSRDEIFFMGRVFEEPARASSGDGTLSLLKQIGRRLLRSGVPGVEVEARFYQATTRVTTDDDGYFRVRLPLEEEPPVDRVWHAVDVRLTDVSESEEVARGRAAGDIFIPPPDARYVVISDIDDTVMYTGVANKIKMFWRLFAQDAQSRVAFPGVASLYAAFYDGPTGSERNPILYVSRGHWGIYEVLVEFFDAHEIPIGPVLFLRDWGISVKRPFPRRARDHKADLIRSMLDLYDELPFVLIGDSGQHDPEIYADIVRENPGRIEAVYIRDISRSSARAGEIAKLAAEVTRAGSSLVLADDSYAMARHAAEHGLISESSLGRVLDERVRQAEPDEERTTGPRVIEG